MKYALIGCGRIAVHHIEAAKNNKLDIVAVCDVASYKMDEKTLHLRHVNKYIDYKKCWRKSSLNL